MSYKPTKEEFVKLSDKGNLIPVYKEILADMETPVSAYIKIGDSDFAFLLESVEGGENIGRYSFLGSEPSLVFKSKGQNVELIYNNNFQENFITEQNPLDELRSILDRYKPVIDPNLPPFFGGAVGYASYDIVRTLEQIPDIVNDDLSLPDCFFMITDNIIIFDRLKHKMTIVYNAHIRDGNPEKTYDEAIHQIEILHEKFRRTLVLSQKLNKVNDLNGEEVSKPEPKKEINLKSNLTQEEYENAVKAGKEYILAGDIFQVVLSQRFETEIECDSFDIYRALRIINPSPYMYYLKFGGLKIIGSSPEILVQLKDGRVKVRPIAGTRRRGRTREEDISLEHELLADPKERAEHIMLVDLGRNDVGRVSEFGTVRVDELMTVERYSHVMHIVSNVVGDLKKGLDGFDVLKACFPAGTVTGAPKVRAMEIIEELEPFRRGPYAGAVGYFSFSGNMDTCITIRTLVIKDEMAYIQAGAGIVADSVPDQEYIETLNKSKGMLNAIQMAEEGLD